MKPIITSIGASLLLVSLTTAHAPRYTLTDLGPVGPGGLPLYISANGIISGAAAARDGSDHAVLWYRRFKVDIARPGLGGANSIAFGVNVFGQAVGAAETGQPDPSGVDFCGFKTYGLPTAGGVCAPFFWQNGVMRKLPTLGGNNGTASQINRWGVAAGEAETALSDPDCPERFQFKPVRWHDGRIHELSTLSGDPDAVAYAINDRGQVVGSSGTCAPFNPALQLACIRSIRFYGNPTARRSLSAASAEPVMVLEISRSTSTTTLTSSARPIWPATRPLMLSSGAARREWKISARCPETLGAEPSASMTPTRSSAFRWTRASICARSCGIAAR